MYVTKTSFSQMMLFQPNADKIYQTWCHRLMSDKVLKVMVAISYVVLNLSRIFEEALGGAESAPPPSGARVNHRTGNRE